MTKTKYTEEQIAAADEEWGLGDDDDVLLAFHVIENAMGETLEFPVKHECGEDCPEDCSESDNDEYGNLDDFKVEHQRDGSMLITHGRHEEWYVAKNDTAEEIAKERADNLIDDMLHDADWVKQHVVPSWERGQTREDFVDDMLRHDGLGITLGTYDHTVDEFRHPVTDEWMVAWRHN